MRPEQMRLSFFNSDREFLEYEDYNRLHLPHIDVKKGMEILSVLEMLEGQKSINIDSEPSRRLKFVKAVYKKACKKYPVTMERAKFAYFQGMRNMIQQLDEIDDASAQFWTWLPSEKEAKNEMAARKENPDYAYENRPETPALIFEACDVISYLLGYPSEGLTDEQKAIVDSKRQN